MTLSPRQDGSLPFRYSSPMYIKRYMYGLWLAYLLPNRLELQHLLTHKLHLLADCKCCWTTSYSCCCYSYSLEGYQINPQNASPSFGSFLNDFHCTIQWSGIHSHETGFSRCHKVFHLEWHIFSLRTVGSGLSLSSFVISFVKCHEKKAGLTTTMVEVCPILADEAHE